MELGMISVPKSMSYKSIFTYLVHFLQLKRINNLYNIFGKLSVFLRKAQLALFTFKVW